MSDSAHCDRSQFFSYCSKFFEYETDVSQLSQHHLVESIREQKRLAEAQLKMLELQEQSLRQGGNARDLEQISRQVKRISLNGPVSEPPTPPEYAENN